VQTLLASGASVVGYVDQFRDNLIDGRSGLVLEEYDGSQQEAKSNLKGTVL